jgi:predicted secreted hydrolase
MTGCAPRDEAHSGSPTGLRYLGGSEDAGFVRALTPREFVFPADHASHPEYQTEWWYFTGNLTAENGRHFGFELTFFRYALAPTHAEVSASAWRSNQAWLAHFAITDTAAGRFHAAERRSRQALGLAGAATSPLRIWVEDWSLTSAGGPATFPLQLRARDREIGLALELASAQPPVAHGERGLSRKGAAPGNASYYYSVPRLEAHGTLDVGGESFAVTGLTWMDREWSTSSLEPGVVGWDWFALNLSDGGSLMFYRLRTGSGESSPFSGGTWVRPDGGRIALAAGDVSLTVREYWQSSATGSRYPIAWRFRVPSANLDLELRPYLQGQELDLSVRYWEGAVRGDGEGSDGKVTAEGYLELTGY